MYTRSVGKQFRKGMNLLEMLRDVKSQTKGNNVKEKRKGINFCVKQWATTSKKKGGNNI